MTKQSLRESIEEHFALIPDQRVTTRSSHKLVELIAIDNFSGFNQLTFRIFTKFAPAIASSIEFMKSSIKSIFQPFATVPI